MSRAFLKDNDGWRYCWPKQTECLFVDDDGTCMCAHCRLEDEHEACGSDAQNAQRRTE